MPAAPLGFDVMCHDMSVLTKKALRALALLLLISSVVAKAEPYPWEMLKDRDFKRAYVSMLGSNAKLRWLAKLDGPANPVEHVKVGTAGEDFVVIKACRPHMCNIDNVVILYSPTRRVAYAKLALSSSSAFLGNPPIEVKALLDERS
jgi:Inhibitor of vertebrate lysozyme (Ivy)